MCLKAHTILSRFLKEVTGGKNEFMGIGTVALKKPKRCAEKLEVRFDCKREIDNYSRMYYVFLYIIKFT